MIKSEICMEQTHDEFLQASNTRTCTSLQCSLTGLAGEHLLGCNMVCVKVFGMFMYLRGFVDWPPFTPGMSKLGRENVGD